jgi:hypothetical protein
MGRLHQADTAGKGGKGATSRCGEFSPIRRSTPEVKYSPLLRGALKIFAGAVLLELAILARKLPLEGRQLFRWDPMFLLVPVVMSLLLAVGQGFWQVRQAKRDVPGAVEFDRYGFSVVRMKGGRERISWRLLQAVVLERRSRWQWSFIHKNGEAVVERSGYSDEEWKDLSNQRDKRLQRRGIEIRMPGDGADVRPRTPSLTPDPTPGSGRRGPGRQPAPNRLVPEPRP